jgi:hypothetical protein
MLDRDESTATYDDLNLAVVVLTPTAAWRDASTPSVFGPVAKVGMTDKGGVPVATFPPSEVITRISR